MKFGMEITLVGSSHFNKISLYLGFFYSFNDLAQRQAKGARIFAPQKSRRF